MTPGDRLRALLNRPPEIVQSDAHHRLHRAAHEALRRLALERALMHLPKPLLVPHRPPDLQVVAVDVAWPFDDEDVAEAMRRLNMLTRDFHTVRVMAPVFDGTVTVTNGETGLSLQARMCDDRPVAYFCVEGVPIGVGAMPAAWPSVPIDTLMLPHAPSSVPHLRRAGPRVISFGGVPPGAEE